MHHLSHIIAVCLALCVAVPQAWADDLNTVVQGVESAYGQISTLQANFVQVTRSATMGETKLKGKLSLERPRKMRWAYPGKLFVTDGTTMWVWTKAENQVIISQVVAGAGQGDMTQLLDNLDKIGELFEVVLLEGTKKSYRLGLTPKNAGNVQRIELMVSRKDYTVEQVKTIDGFDNVMELTLHKVKTNVKIPSESFRFDIPANAQVIKTDGP